MNFNVSTTPSKNPWRESLRHVALATIWGWNQLWGLVCLIMGLAVLAALPLLQFLSLGYMLEASGRVARSGRLRDGLSGLDTARQVGTIGVCSWLLILPIRVVSDLAGSSELINGHSPGWNLALVLALLVVLTHIAWACVRGGRFRDFLWPAPWQFCRYVRQGRFLSEGSQALGRWVSRRQIPHRFWLGFLACVSGLVWLAPPITLLLLAIQAGGLAGVLLGLLGIAFLSRAIWYVPVQQARFAMSQDWRALFQFDPVRSIQGRAPLTHAVALSLMLILAVPLYLLKAELIPREAAWLPNLLFVASVYPAKLVMGWAVYIGTHRTGEAMVLWRWGATLVLIPVVAAYLLIVYLTQYTSWYGLASLYEQHAFLLPVPFVNW